jgi:hypothetical protein
MNLDNKKFNPLGKDWLMGKAGEKESQAKDESTVEAVDESVESSEEKTEDVKKQKTEDSDL